MKTVEKTRKLLIVGIVGCLRYVTGDFLYAATGKEQTTETIGLFTKIAYLDMATWRMWPINQLDHGTESFGHALVLMLGLILLKEMTKAGEIAKHIGG